MDLYVERQCIQQIKEGNIKQFLLLFDANFADLYKYVARRVGDVEVADKIVRLTFIDALGQAQSTPDESAYIVWLCGLARPRVWEEISRSSFPEKQGLISVVATDGQAESTENEEAISKVDKMMKKLSLEEREIFRLKFFEEVSDGDVMSILSISEGSIGSKIYGVLKRAHFLLFGKSDERQGVYFGELTGLLSRVRELEKIVIPEVLKLSLRADLAARIDRKEFAINSEPMEEERPKEPPVKVVTEVFKGSNDPAKIFVSAVKEMREEEEIQKMQDSLKFEREEKIFDFLERWKWAFTVVPGMVFVGLIGIFIFNFWSNRPIERGYITACKIEVKYKGDFSDAEIRNVDKGISDQICGHFDVKKLLISRLDDGKVQVNVDVPKWLLEYKFAKKLKDPNAGVTAAVNAGPWRIKEYARTLSSNEKSGEV
ncbi:MAG: RNA polymerase sigma factor [Candidatus Peregrinibacteria bacterium]|nr:RNA polymerase sigma factor [Candidatus Peregrinibacteria bacterium]